MRRQLMAGDLCNPQCDGRLLTLSNRFATGPIRSVGAGFGRILHSGTVLTSAPRFRLLGSASMVHGGRCVLHLTLLEPGRPEPAIASIPSHPECGANLGEGFSGLLEGSLGSSTVTFTSFDKQLEWGGVRQWRRSPKRAKKPAPFCSEPCFERITWGRRRRGLG